MIDYSETKRGDILKIAGAGAPGWAELGDLVRVTSVAHNAVTVEDKHGKPCEFLYNCGAARLEPTEWRDDFPANDETHGLAVSLNISDLNGPEVERLKAALKPEPPDETA